jgi:hypothetical protein
LTLTLAAGAHRFAVHTYALETQSELAAQLVLQALVPQT